MSANNNDVPDTSSIRPVSALKSRFENLGAAGPFRPPASPIRTPVKQPGLTQSDTHNTRASFELSRPILAPESRRSSPGLGQEQSETSDARDGLARPRIRDGFRAPRPMSMGPTSPPETPALTIQTPQSPPKPVFSLDHGGLGPSTPLTRPKSVGPGPRPLVPPPLVRPFRPPGANGEKSPTAGERSPRAPPPVNRASKPIIGNVPALVHATLAPDNPPEDDSVSPFSTPPDSPVNEPHAQGSFPPPPVHHQVLARRTSRAGVPGRGAGGYTRPGVRSPSDEPENRPALPARHVVNEPGIISTHSPFRQDNPAPLQYTQSIRTTSRRRSPDPGLLHHSQSVQTPIRSQPPPRPSEESKDGRKPSSSQVFLPPPKRIAATNGGASSTPRAVQTSFSDILPPESRNKRDASPRNQQYQIKRVGADDADFSDASTKDSSASSTDYPDASMVNRRPPKTKHGADHVWTHYDTRLFDICGKNVCSSGYITRAWDTVTGKMTLDLAPEERESKILSMVFKPGATADEEGLRVWLGDNHGDIQEVDLEFQQIINHRTRAHGFHDVIKMHRCQNTIWSLDSDARLFVWLPGKKGVPDLDISPNSHRVARGPTFSIVARDKLWLACGKEIRVYDPVCEHERTFVVTAQPMSQPNTGDICTGAVLPTQLDRVYFGHGDGKVSIYSTESYSCQAVINVSTYKIITMAGVGSHIWAGFSNGYVLVYDIASTPWKVKKEWRAHDNPIASLVVDRSSVWRFGHLKVASIGLDNAIRFWDGMLEEDWLEDEMHRRDVEYCEFHEIKSVIVTWNAGASTPMDIRHDEKDTNFFREVVRAHDPPDIIVFGFQELVDLEDKSLTAKNLFKGRHKNKDKDSEHMGHQYRAWRDFLVRIIEETMPSDQPYSVLQTGSMVGLFSCVFIRSPLRTRVRDLEVAEVKRGMGGLYGNKGAIMVRFVLDSTSLCFTNCHLAAGQKETLARNNDATAILEACALGLIRSSQQRIDAYIGGGDGTMIIDHEICILNGDLNYRIDTMGRDSVVKTIRAGNLDRLLERDQLLLSKRRNPGLRLRTFREEKITFAPTYKYDVRTDQYDSSEKNRSPAWCDRILYRGPGRVKMTEYRRHECQASDHRPVSGSFKMRVKSVLPERRIGVWEDVQSGLINMKMKTAEAVRLDYLVNVLGVDPKEARRLVSTQ